MKIYQGNGLAVERCTVNSKAGRPVRDVIRDRKRSSREYGSSGNV